MIHHESRLSQYIYMSNKTHSFISIFIKYDKNYRPQLQSRGVLFRFFTSELVPFFNIFINSVIWIVRSWQEYVVKKRPSPGRVLYKGDPFHEALSYVHAQTGINTTTKRYVSMRLAYATRRWGHSACRSVREGKKNKCNVCIRRGCWPRFVR